MPRWECPEGKHRGVIGPARPRRDHACRWCLDCTRDAGKLVARTCPAMDTRKRRAQERAADAAAKRAARALLERQAVAAAREDARKRKDGGRHHYPGNLQELARRWSRLKAWGRHEPVRIRVSTTERNPAWAWTLILWRFALSNPDDSAWRFTFFAAIKEVFGDFEPGVITSTTQAWNVGMRAIMRAVGGDRALALFDDAGRVPGAVDVLRDLLLENDPAQPRTPATANNAQRGGQR